MRATLVVAPNWVGDLVMALPVLEALAASHRELAVLARPHLAPLLRLAPAAATVIERAAGDRDTVRRLRAAALDEAVVLPNSFRSAWLPFRAGVPRRWGYRGGLRRPLLDRSVPRPSRRGHQSEDYRELLAAMAVAAPADWTPRLALGGTERARGAALLERAGVAADAVRVGLFPGAEFGPSKRWPAARFGELAHALRRRVPGVAPVVFAGPKEVWLAVLAHEASGHTAPVVGPDLDLGELAAALAELDLLITNDSGPMHLAAAVGVPCVALFGPTDPRRTAPAGAGHAVLYGDRWCSPCFRRRCPLLHHRCLRDFGVDEVADRAAAALGSGVAG